MTSEYRVPADTKATNVDLDVEEIRLPDGTRLTEARAEEIAAAALASWRQRNLVPGRKSLARDGSHSPVMQFRVAEPKRVEAERLAAERGVSISALAREALDEYLKRHPSA